MRKLGLIAVTAVASLGVTSFAQAIEGGIDQRVDVAVKGGKGSKKKPRDLAFTVTTSTTAKNADLNGQYATKSAVIHFDKNLRFNNKKFPACSLAIVAVRANKCKKGSKVGSGLANSIVGPLKLRVNPTIEAYNGPKNTINLKLIGVPGEVDASSVLVGTLKKDSGKNYGQKLVVPIPKKLQKNNGLIVTLTKFSVAINKKTFKVKTKKNGKTKTTKYAYVNSVGCPKGGKYNFGGDFVFSDNSKENVTSKTKC